MDNEKKQVTYNSSFSGETQVTLDIQQYMNNKAMYIGLMCNEDGYDEPFGIRRCAGVRSNVRGTFYAGKRSL